MLRMRVYRLAVPLTVMGLDVWALLTIGAGTLMSLQYWQDRVPAILTLPLAALSGFALSKVIGFIRYLFPGRALMHVLAWLTQGDRYRVMRDLCSYPLIVPREDRFLVRPSRKPVKRARRPAVPGAPVQAIKAPISAPEGG
ncbi:hypothetical protein [Deinococcus koreensis]|uniref:Uncharacterized protein n=1 Tax=Deinococcus koreensis TaxID=2054903 RepID=A0A2K3UT00_9DEIO|nr:hypothetical protein [Deinococcus koreensis]PNY79659.1 hypothetical protein CVO96_16985 [Deinococcus koreensis]